MGRLSVVYEALYIDLGMDCAKFGVLSNCDNWSIRESLPFNLLAL